MGPGAAKGGPFARAANGYCCYRVVVGAPSNSILSGRLLYIWQSPFEFFCVQAFAKNRHAEPDSVAEEKEEPEEGSEGRRRTSNKPHLKGGEQQKTCAESLARLKAGHRSQASSAECSRIGPTDFTDWDGDAC